MAMVERVRNDLKAFLKANPSAKKEDIPSDSLINSGSGLDPDFSPMAANIQVPRIAKERNVDAGHIYALVEMHTEDRQFGLFGEKRVNVLLLNKALDEMK